MADPFARFIEEIIIISKYYIYVYYLCMSKRKSILIIGAGVVGCAAARHLSRYDVDITVLEKSGDAGEGSTKANSGIVHAGYAAKHGSLKSRLCVHGNFLYDQLEGELNFGFRRSGSLVLGYNDEDLSVIESLLENGLKNNVPGLWILDNEKILSLDPGINENVKYALYAPTAGVTSPYEFAIALAENSIANGAEFHFNSKVESLTSLNDGGYEVETLSDSYKADYVINASGLFSDIISKKAGFDYFTITPRKGQYLIFDRFSGRELNSVLFQVPTKMGKGILVTSTYHNNLMIGPDALDTDDREDVGTDNDSLLSIIEKAALSFPDLETKKIIRSFAGLRAVGSRGDFIIEFPEGSRTFINAAGIESPGLTSSPAIALRIEKLLRDAGLELKERPDFNPYREGIIKKREELPVSEVSKLTQLPSSDEKIICRCEQVREGIIRDSLRRGVFVDSTDGVKRRTRSGMGICQGTYCRSRVRSVISDEYGIPEEDIKVSEKGKEDFSFLKHGTQTEKGP